MQEYESVLLSKNCIEILQSLRMVVKHTDQPTINDIVLAMATDYNILSESDVALIYNGWGFEMIRREEIKEIEGQ